MSIFPEIIAGYDAARTALAGKPVKLDHPGSGSVHRPATDPIELIGSFPAAYSVEAFILREGVNVIRNGRWGFDEQMTFIDYPVPTTAPDFPARLAEVLVPVVDQELWLAAEHKHRDSIEHGPNAGYEATDAVRKL
ncbi:hypothetical protein ABZ215_24910 [Amycolatopsis sp. NPDC006131]|uniref:hypothetical protein n=1 Tax=Amycolatopsis sp. NPDC006131 TaxID=3156731 RepID=UPI0033A9FD5F